MYKLSFSLLLFLCFSLLTAADLQQIKVTWSRNDHVPLNIKQTSIIFSSSIPNLKFFDYSTESELDSLHYDQENKTYTIITSLHKLHLSIRAKDFMEKEFIWRFKDARKIYYSIDPTPLNCDKDPGTVLINTTPNNANIKFMTKITNNTLSPYIFVGKNNETCRITISKKNFETIDTTFVVDGTKFQVLHFELRSLNTVTFNVNYAPANAKVYLNNTFAGFTPLRLKWPNGLKPHTSYQYRIERESCVSKSGSFDTDTLSAVNLTGELEELLVASEEQVEIERKTIISSLIGCYPNPGFPDFKPAFLYLNAEPAVSVPGLFEYKEMFSLITNKYPFYIGLTTNIFGPVVIAKDFYTIDWMSLGGVLQVEAKDSKYKSSLEITAGYIMLNEQKKNYHGKSVVYGEFGGNFLVEAKDINKSWIPAEVKFTLDYEISKTLSFNLIAGGFFLNNSKYFAYKGWYLKEDLLNWQPIYGTPYPERINQKFGLPEKYKFMPYIGIGINFKSTPDGKYLLGI